MYKMSVGFGVLRYSFSFKSVFVLNIYDWYCRHIQIQVERSGYSVEREKKKKKNTCAVLMCACLPAACLHAYSSMLKKNTHFSIWYSLSVNVNRNFDECGSRVLCLYIINKILLYVFVFIISLFSSSSSSPFARTSYSIHLIVFHCIFSVCITIYWCSLQMVRVLVV